MSGTPKILRRLYFGAEGLLLLGSLVGAALIASPEEWEPLSLALLLAVLTLAGGHLEVVIRAQRLSSDFVALVLAMALLGPVPALSFGIAATVYEATRRTETFDAWLARFATMAVFPFVGGLAIRAFAGNVHDPLQHAAIREPAFAVAVFVIAIASNALNFLMIALTAKVTRGRGVLDQIRSLFIPLLPSQLAACALASLLTIAYINFGFDVLLGLIVVLLIFQYLNSALVRSEERADQLATTARRLASLQLGVLTMLMDGLQMRDQITAHHAASVARYARALARETSCSNQEQELVHTAGLLHDIGKFTLPDEILHAKVLVDENDWRAIRRHPVDGATLVGRIEGYGPVAEIIRSHHERLDGTGYPQGLIGDEIPKLSRIIAICEAYDVMTARESYRTPMTPADAFQELRRSAGTQFDPELVEVFIRTVREQDLGSERPGSIDFDAELEFERRVRAMTTARPH
jgi:putative nucleotidyltransferase with HDIG domain